MGASDPRKEIRSAMGKWESCLRPETDRLRDMCRDHGMVKDSNIKSTMLKDMKKIMGGKITSCSKTLEKDISNALKDYKSLPPDMTKELNDVSKYVKALPGKSCLVFDTSVKGTTFTVKPSLKAK